MKNRQDTITELITIAKQDIADANTLYNTQSYGNALYHVQQAVEKIMKALALTTYTRLEHEKLMHRIGHDSHRVILLMIEEGLPRLTDIFTRLFKLIGNEDLEDSYNQLLNQMTSTKNIEGKYFKHIIEKKPDKLKSIYKQMSKDILESSQQDGIVQQLVDYAENSREYSLLMISFLEMVISSFSIRLPDKYKKIGDYIISFIEEYSLDMSERFVPVILLTILTAPYEAVTRYPNEMLYISQLNEDSEIIKNFPRIAKLTQNAINWLEDNLEGQFYSQYLLEGIIDEIIEEVDFEKIKNELKKLVETKLQRMKTTKKIEDVKSLD